MASARDQDPCLWKPGITFSDRGDHITNILSLSPYFILNFYLNYSLIRKSVHMIHYIIAISYILLDTMTRIYHSVSKQILV
jgi:hypothetical protein